MRLPEYFEFFNQAKFMSGKKTLSNIPVELSDYDARKPLIITSKENRCAAKKVVSAFKDSNLVIGAVYTGVKSVSVENVTEVMELFVSRHCDSIIALGGESIVAVAKLANIALSEGNGNFKAIQQAGGPSARLKPFFIVPVDQADGLETSNSVTIDGIEIKSPYLFPDLIIIDPEVAKLRNKAALLNSGLFSLANSVDTYTSSDRNPLTDSYAFTSIQYIVENLKKGVRCGCRKQVLSIVNGVAFSGTAVANNKIGSLGALSLAVSQVTGLKSGVTAGIVLPAMIEEKSKKNSDAVADMLKAIGGIDIYAASPKADRVNKCIALAKEFKKSLKSFLPQTLKNAGVEESKLNAIADTAAKISAELTVDEYLTVLKKSY